jgi:hypothetical protein
MRVCSSTARNSRSVVIAGSGQARRVAPMPPNRTPFDSSTCANH